MIGRRPPEGVQPLAAVSSSGRPDGEPCGGPLPAPGRPSHGRFRWTGREPGCYGSRPYDAPAIQLVDARTGAEYAAGHIPSAQLREWPANLTSGRLKPRAELEALYDALAFDPTRTTVTYCLVGWRASVAWLSLRWLGYDDVRVYDGSWLEWGAGGFPVEP